MNNIKIKLAIFVCIVVTLIVIPLMSFAHESYWLQTFIDTSDNLYYGNVLDDNPSADNEANHLEAKFGLFYDVMKAHDVASPTKLFGVSYTASSYTIYKPNDVTVGHAAVGTYDAKMPLEFAYETDNNKLTSAAINNATSNDADRANFIKDTLVSSLNDALVYLNNGKSFTSAKELMVMTSALTNAKEVVNGTSVYTISYNNTTTPTSVVNDSMYNVTNSDYVNITKTVGSGVNAVSETQTFIWRLNKGYLATNLKSGVKSLGASDQAFYSTDFTYITINDIAFQSNYAYLEMKETAVDAGQSSNEDSFQQEVAGLFSWILESVRSMLGLYSFNDLILNQGTRGSSYWCGILNKSWSRAINIYYWVFEVIAWLLLTLALLKIILQKSMSTVNLTAKISMMEGIRDFFITGFLLMNIYPMVNLLAYFNVTLVNVLQAAAPLGLNYTKSSASSSVIGAIILDFFYLIIELYMNFTYVMRSITCAILIAGGPIFVVSIAFGGKWKNLFVSWLKELVGNIFLQTFHCFLLGMFIVAQSGAHTIEVLIIAYAFIPLTDFFRTLVLGQAGGFAGQLGIQTLLSASSLAAGAAQTLGRGASKGKSSGSGAGANSNSGFESESGEKNNNKEQTRGGNSVNTKIGNSDRMTRASSSQSLNNQKSYNVDAMDTGASALDTGMTANTGGITNEAVAGVSDKAIGATAGASSKLTVDTAGKNGSLGTSLETPSGKSSAPTPKSYKDGYSRLQTANKVFGSVGNVAKGAATVAGGIGKASLGIGLALAAGPASSKIATSLVQGGLGNIQSVASKIPASNLKEGLTNEFQSISDEHYRNDASIAAEQYKKSGDLPNTMVGYSEKADGSSDEVHDRILTEETGLSNAHKVGNNFHLEYDGSKLAPNDVANMNSIRTLSEAGDTDSLKAQGIEGFAVKTDSDKHDHYHVLYNKEGMNNLGANSIQKTEKGYVVNRGSFNTPMQRSYGVHKVDKPANDKRNSNGGSSGGNHHSN